MRVSGRVRILASALAVVFVLTTVWAAYYLDAQVHPAGTTSAGTTVAAYSQTGANSFAAAVSPSTLYNNSSEVFGGNVTLFTPITNWINVSLVYALVADRPATISAEESFTVGLSTSVWSKPLLASTNATSVTNATFLTLPSRYNVNVTSVVNLAAAIDRQIGFVGTEFVLSIVPHITGTIAVAGLRQPFAETPMFNLTFSGSLITPTGLNYTSSGELVTPAAPSTGGAATAVVPSTALAVSLGGLGGSLWFATRRPEDEVVPPLDQMIAPYEEAIAETEVVVGSASLIRVDRFADLVKVADTLGKPILRPGPPDSSRLDFVVLDGTWAYTFRYPGSSEILPPPPAPTPSAPNRPPAPGSTGGAAAGTAGPATARTAPPTPAPTRPAPEAGRTTPYVPPTSSWTSAVAAPRAPPAPAGSAGASDDTSGLSPGSLAVTRLLKREMARMETLLLDRDASSEARARIRRTMEMVQSNDLAGAYLEVTELSQLLTRAGRRPGAATAPPGDRR